MCAHSNFISPLSNLWAHIVIWQTHLVTLVILGPLSNFIGLLRVLWIYWMFLILWHFSVFLNLYFLKNFKFFNCCVFPIFQCLEIFIKKLSFILNLFQIYWILINIYELVFIFERKSNLLKFCKNLLISLKCFFDFLLKFLNFFQFFEIKLSTILLLFFQIPIKKFEFF